MIEVNIAKKLRSANAFFELDVEICIKPREFVTLFGKSGAGKTTILKIIAGLIKADKGTISVNGHIWQNVAKNQYLAPQKRDIGFAFQDYALFPNMTVKENIEYAYSAKDKSLFNKLLLCMGLTELINSYPENLSGGQKQRVSLARALARSPKLLLLDEPLSALDSETRLSIQVLLKEIHEQFDTTIIMVSHDIAEVCKLSDKVFLIENGKIVVVGKPIEVFSKEFLSNPCLACKHFSSSAIS